MPCHITQTSKRLQAHTYRGIYADRLSFNRRGRQCHGHVSPLHSQDFGRVNDLLRTRRYFDIIASHRYGHHGKE